MCLFACKTNNSINQSSNDIKVILNCTLEGNKIKLLFTNVGNEGIELYSPCLTNTFINLKSRGIAIPRKILFRAGCDTEIFKLKKDGQSTFFYPYNITELYDLRQFTDYEMTVEYCIYNKGKIIQKIESNIYQFKQLK